MSIKEKVTNSFVDDWKEAWKWVSVQFAVIAGAIATWIVTDPTSFTKLMQTLPEQYRPIIGLLVTFIPIYLRLKKQGVSEEE